VWLEPVAERIAEVRNENVSERSRRYGSGVKSEPDLAATEDDDSIDSATAEPLVGVQSWPGVASSYRLSGMEQPPLLAVTVSAQPDLGLPEPTDTPQQAALLAAHQAEQYRLIRKQLDDPNLTVSLLTTLDPELVLPSADGLPSLRRFAAAAQLFAKGAAAARPPELAGIATLGELLDHYGLAADRLAGPNVNLALHSVLSAGQPLAMRTGQLEPDTVPADPSTLGQVAARLGITPERLLEDNRGLRLAIEPALVLPGIVALPVDARTPYLTRAGDTLGALARRFGTRARELVAANAEVTGTLPVGVHVEIGMELSTDASVEVVTAGTDTVAGDSFRSVCTRLVEQHAGITLDAVTDALEHAGAVLAPDVVLSCPLAVLGSGWDGDSATALTGAEVHAEHGCPPAIFAAANAAVLGLLQPGVQLSAAGRTVTTAERDTLNAVLARLAADGRTPSIAELMADNATVPLFRAGGRALLPPTAVTFTAAVGQPSKPAAPAVALVVTLRLQRAGAATDGASSTPPAEYADTAVPPGQDGDALVEAYLAAAPTVRLATDDQDRLWAVSFGADGIAGVRIEPSADALGPGVLGLRRVYQQLVDFDAAIRPVTPDGSLGTPAMRRFHQLDIEPLARLFLSDLERYLSEPLNARLPDTVRVQLADVRRRLAAAIAAGLAPLLDEPDDPAAPAALLSARAALVGIARTNLVLAYATVIAQYRAVAVSPYGYEDLPSAWLVGTVELAGRSDISLSTSRTALDPSNAWCTFALTSADPTGTTSVSIQPRQVFDGLELDSAASDAAEPVLLRFVRPLAGGYRPVTVVAELPTADLPLPIREYPSPPSVYAMTAEPTFSGPEVPTLAEAAQWTAGLRYSHQHAAQDVITLSWAEPLPVPPSADSMTLAEALAAYTGAAAELAELIGTDAQPPEIDTDVDTGIARNAAASLAELGETVAAAWAQHWAGRDSAVPPDATPTAGYRLRAAYVTNADGGRLLDRLIVHRAGPEYGWPVISLDSADRLLPLTPGPVSGHLREYLPAEPASPDLPAFRLEWPGLRGAPHPDAGITVTAERNAGLRISPAFLLISAAQRVDVARPAVRWSEELQLTGSDIAEALQNAFDAVVGEQPDGEQSDGEQSDGEQPENIRLTIEVGYAEPVGELRTVLPVLLMPDQPLNSRLARAIATRLADWQRIQQRATAGAQWRIRLAVLSANRDEPPILEFDQLVFPAGTQLSRA
jgi:LysM domain-containing protein